MIKKQNKKVLLFQNHGKPFLILSESSENQPPPPPKKKKKENQTNAIKNEITQSLTIFL